MNAFDILTVVVVSFCLIRGVFKGLIGEMSGIIGVIAAFYGAYTYYPMITPYIQKWIETPSIRNIIAFFLIFCIILIIVGIVALLIRKILNFVFLGWVDRIFGLLFGAAKGILIMSVIFIILASFFPHNSKFLTTSKFVPYIARISETLTVIVSKNNRKNFLKQIDILLQNEKP